MACAGTVLAENATKACSGKCQGEGGCSSASFARLWVVAACDGMLSLFDKSQQGELRQVPFGGDAVASSVDVFRQLVKKTLNHGIKDKIILVGSPSDLAWARVSLPEELMGNVVAEVQYPLLERWFHLPEMNELKQAIGRLF